MIGAGFVAMCAYGTFRKKQHWRIVSRAYSRGFAGEMKFVEGVRVNIRRL
jgi:hypothetical protein